MENNVELIWRQYRLGAYDAEYKFWDDLADAQGLPTKHRRNVLRFYIGDLANYLGQIGVDGAYFQWKKHIPITYWEKSADKAKRRYQQKEIMNKMNKRFSKLFKKETE